MRTFIAALSLLAAAPVVAEDAAPAAAQASAPAAGQLVRDANNLRIGVIDRVTADGSVRLIYDQRFVTIPADKITMVDGKPVSTLTRREVSRLR